MSTGQNNQNGGDGNYSAFNALTNLFTTTNPILAPPSGARSAIGFGPNIRIPEQRNFGTASVVPGPMGVVVSPKSGMPHIPVPRVPSLNLNVDPNGRVTNQNSYGVPPGVPNYKVDYKLGYGVNSPFHAPKIIDDDKLPKTPVMSPVGPFGGPFRGPMMGGPAMFGRTQIGPGPLPPAPIGIPPMGVVGSPLGGVRVVSPVPVLPPPHMGLPALSMGLGIPRVNLNPNYKRVVVNYGPFLEVVEGTNDEIRDKLKGRVPDIDRWLGQKSVSVPVDPQKVLQNVRAQGVRWRVEGELLVASAPMTGGYQYGGEDPPGASSAAGTTANPPAGGVTQTVGAASVQPGATVDPSGGVTRTAVQQPVQAQQQQAQQQQQQQQQQVQSGVAESGVQPSQQVPAPSAPPAPSRLSAESGVAPSAVSEKLLKFRSSNLIVLSNIEVNGKKYGVALAFRKQNSNGSFVLSPYCKLDLPKNGEQVSEANLFAAAKKSIEMASSGAIKLNVQDHNRIYAFNNLITKDENNRTYVVFVDNVDVDNYRKILRESRNGTSDQSSSFEDMKFIDLSQINESRENYGRPVIVTDRFSQPGLQFRLALHPESDNQLKAVVKSIKDKVTVTSANDPKPTSQYINNVLVIQ